MLRAGPTDPRNPNLRKTRQPLGARRRKRQVHRSTSRSAIGVRRVAQRLGSQVGSTDLNRNFRLDVLVDLRKVGLAPIRQRSIEVGVCQDVDCGVSNRFSGNVGGMKRVLDRSHEKTEGLHRIGIGRAALRNDDRVGIGTLAIGSIGVDVLHADTPCSPLGR